MDGSAELAGHNVVRWLDACLSSCQLRVPLSLLLSIIVPLFSMMYCCYLCRSTLCTLDASHDRVGCHYLMPFPHDFTIAGQVGGVPLPVCNTTTVCVLMMIGT